MVWSHKNEIKIVFDQREKQKDSQAKRRIMALC
jgi:hypothetical protein